MTATISFFTVHETNKTRNNGKERMKAKALLKHTPITSVKPHEHKPILPGVKILSEQDEFKDHKFEKSQYD